MFIELSKFIVMYYQQDMDESHKDPEVVPTFDTKDWPKTLEMMNWKIIIFRGVYGQPLSYGLRDDLEPPASTSDTLHRANGSKYFTHDEEMIAC